MRLVLTKHLKDGDIIAQDIISSEGGVLLRHDTRFKEVFKSKLIERNILEVYVDDEISKGIEPTKILDTTSKNIIKNDIKSEFDKLKDNLELDVQVLNRITHFLIEQLGNKELIIELEDLKTNDYYTYEHCIAVAILTEVVCNKMQIGLEKKVSIVMGALIHDIGKMILPKDILNKPSRLNEEEYNLIKTHPEVGYMMIKENRELDAITKLIVLCHHEREDQSGYPFGKGKELHIGAKIVAACDLYHALISDRCYRKGLPISEAIAIAQREPINPGIRKVIESCFAYYPVGGMVYLNDGNIAIVERNFSADIKRPLVRVVIKEGRNVKQTYKINLQEEHKYYITGRYEGEL